jgi:hypothetical protein
MENNEEMFKRHNVTAPRVTAEHIESVIAKTEFFRLSDVLTVCVLTLVNGFSVRGESACASPENYRQEIGEKFAREDAVRKIWPLEGYLLKQRLHEQTLNPVAEGVNEAAT